MTRLRQRKLDGIADAIAPLEVDDPDGADLLVLGGQLNKLLGEMRSALSQIRIPGLFIHSKDDDYVLPGNMELIFAGLVNAPDKTKQYVTGSGHVTTRDAAHRQVFQYALDFIQRIAASQVQI